MTTNLSQVEFNVKSLLGAANGGADPDVNVTIPPVLDDLDEIVSTLATKRLNKVCKHSLLKELKDCKTGILH